MVKNSPANAGDTGLIPGLGRFPGGGNGNPLQYSCLKNPMDRGASWAIVLGAAKSQTQLNTHTHTKDISACQNWGGMLLTPQGLRPRILLNTPQFPEQSPTTKNYLTQNVNNIQGKKPCFRETWQMTETHYLLFWSL